MFILLQGPAQVPADYTWLAQFGFAAIAAAGMFFIYRADRKASEDRLVAAKKESEDRLFKVTEDFKTIIEENTAAITALQGTLKNGNR